MNDYKIITKLFENNQDEIGFRLFKESNIIKLIKIIIIMIITISSLILNH